MEIGALYLQLEQWTCQMACINEVVFPDRDRVARSAAHLATMTRSTARISTPQPFSMVDWSYTTSED
jgi:hypothetical protein